MNAYKKKSRQRNRQRNKANRENLLSDETEIESINNENSAVENSKIDEVSAPKLCGINERSMLTPMKVAEVEKTPVVCENAQAIKIIQQIMRAKLLKSANKDMNVKANQNPETDSTTIQKSKSNEKIGDALTEKSAFIESLKKKMGNVMANGSIDLPDTLFGNLKKLINQDPISDVESSDEDEEYIEYIYNPRQYFLVSLCNLCKSDLRAHKLFQCTRCKMTYYCSMEHMKNDQQHRHFCYALQQLADSSGNHIFYKCGDFTTDQFRSYRIVTIRKVESIINRPLTAAEKEVILFPRICCDIRCREYRFDKLTDCKKCGQVAYCKDKPDHLNKFHNLWCRPYQLFKEMIMFQEKFGRLDPSLPSKVLTDIPGACSNTKQILSKLDFDMHDPCEYAALSQISTGPLTAWYALKLCDNLKKGEVMTVHLIGAEIEFEVDVLHKWELFFLHITPAVNKLNVVFVGPELNPRNISFEQLKKTKCCRTCQRSSRTVNYHFENQIYHQYCDEDSFLKPDLICFFNAGLYRSTGFHMEDTWPETILAAANLKCPVVVTSYTEYEAPLDMSRFVQECNRRLNVVLPPTVNPFASDKPERNFISDEDAPLMFKNYYCFVVE